MHLSDRITLVKRRLTVLCSLIIFQSLLEDHQDHYTNNFPLNQPVK